MLGSPPPTNTAFWLEHMTTKWILMRWTLVMSSLYETHIWWCHHIMLSGLEMFTAIFLQFLPKNKARQVRSMFRNNVFFSKKTIKNSESEKNISQNFLNSQQVYIVDKHHCNYTDFVQNKLNMEYRISVHHRPSEPPKKSGDHFLRLSKHIIEMLCVSVNVSHFMSHFIISLIIQWNHILSIISMPIYDFY